MKLKLWKREDFPVTASRYSFGKFFLPLISFRTVERRLREEEIERVNLNFRSRSSSFEESFESSLDYRTPLKQQTHRAHKQSCLEINVQVREGRSGLLLINRHITENKSEQEEEEQLFNGFGFTNHLTINVLLVVFLPSIFGSYLFLY